MSSGILRISAGFFCVFLRLLFDSGDLLGQPFWIVLFDIAHFLNFNKILFRWVVDVTDTWAICLGLMTKLVVAIILPSQRCSYLAVTQLKDNNVTSNPCQLYSPLYHYSQLYHDSELTGFEPILPSRGLKCWPLHYSSDIWAICLDLITKLVVAISQISQNRQVTCSLMIANYYLEPFLTYNMTLSTFRIGPSNISCISIMIMAEVSTVMGKRNQVLLSFRIEMKFL